MLYSWLSLSTFTYLRSENGKSLLERWVRKAALQIPCDTWAGGPNIPIASADGVGADLVTTLLGDLLNGFPAKYGYRSIDISASQASPTITSPTQQTTTIPSSTHSTKLGFR
eukprot:1509190-Amphidinium_carterae.1